MPKTKTNQKKKTNPQAEGDAYECVVKHGPPDSRALDRGRSIEQEQRAKPPEGMTDEEAENLGRDASTAKPAISKEDDYSNRIRTLLDDKE